MCGFHLEQPQREFIDDVIAVISLWNYVFYFVFLSM